MRTSATLSKIAPALTAAMGEMINPAMTGLNPHFRSKYAKLPDILNAVRPILDKHALCALQATVEGPGVSTMILHTSGEWIESEPVLMTPSKDDPQGAMAALTYARRGSLCAMLGIAGEEDDDGNAAIRPVTTQRDTGRASQSGPAGGGSRNTITEKQAKFLYVLCGKKSSDPDGTRKAILEKTGVKKFEELPYDVGKQLIDDMAARPDIEGGYGGPSDDDVNLNDVPF